MGEHYSFTFKEDGTYSTNGKEFQIDLIEVVSEPEDKKEETKMIKLKVGGKYRRRDGVVVVIEERKSDPNYPEFIFWSNYGDSYREDGRCRLCDEDPNDIVEEIIEETPQITEPGTYMTLGGEYVELTHSDVISSPWKCSNGYYYTTGGMAFTDPKCSHNIDMKLGLLDPVKPEDKPVLKVVFESTFKVGETYKDGNGNDCKIVAEGEAPDGTPVVRDESDDHYHAVTGQFLNSEDGFQPAHTARLDKGFSLVKPEVRDYSHLIDSKPASPETLETLDRIIHKPEETKPEPTQDSGLISLDKQYRTRGGDEVKLFYIIPAELDCTDFPVRGDMQGWKLTGAWGSSEDSDYDLIEVEPTRTYQVEVTTLIDIEATSEDEAIATAKTLVPGAINTVCRT